MIRLPPISTRIATLFPYTTLFPSHQVARDRQHEPVHARLGRAVDDLADLRVLRRDRGGEDDRAALAVLQFGQGRHALGGDRSDAIARGQYARDAIFIVRGRGGAVLAGLLVEGERLAAPRGHRAVTGDPLLPV